MILAILQARLSSSRLPGKVLKPIMNKPMLAYQLERLARCKNIDQLIVATSDHPEDLAIADLCQELSVPCFHGPLEDVLARFYLAAENYQPTHIVRLTGDCPLADPELIDDLISYHVQGGYDYSSNCHVHTFPDGLDAEILTYQSLKTIYQQAQTPAEHEHVTYYVHQHKADFNIGLLSRTPPLAHLRWTVDEPADFELVKHIYERLYPLNPNFSTNDILSLIEREPELATLNTHHQRNEGLARSLAKESHS
ncbi:glycosyltransferase family protein [uncultured Tolumonas sp.]|uniref:glycosyltransferase family protein n=1 Tax=uncultured Tolumonas sp. TaxID=263765 RepID=UPI002A0A9B08|nr:glycosyltransferase family protein [uncultured Tolumonas sp.]